MMRGGAVLGLGTGRAAAPNQHGFLHRVHKDAAGREAKYVVFVPQDYRGDKPYPLLLFLHGSGESGSDGRKQLKIGLGPAIKKQATTFPFIAVFPQSQNSTWQAKSKDADSALAILAEVEKEFRVDPRRIYLTGLSLGGYGVWGLAAKYPKRWAAIVPICGGGDPASAEEIKDIPCWCFHGSADTSVGVARSRQMIAALKAAGGNPTYTEYARVGHNCWDRAYATPELFPWLLEQQAK